MSHSALSDALNIVQIKVSQYGSPSQMEYVKAVLNPPKEDEIQIIHAAVGVNFIDVYFRTGLYSQPLPHGLGFEGAGVVNAVGSQVKGFKVGDRVAYCHGAIGAYSTARNIEAKHVVHLPDDIAFESCVSMLLKGLTVHYLLKQIKTFEPGQTVLLYAAAGGVGLLFLQWAKHMGLKVIGVVSSQAKADKALQTGAWRVINTSVSGDVAAEVLKYTNGAKVCAVFDSIGKATWSSSLACLAPRGLMVSFGNASGAVSGVELADLANHGSLMVTRPVLRDFISQPGQLQSSCDQLFDMVRKGAIVPSFSSFNFNDMVAVHTSLEKRETMGSMIVTFSTN